MGTLLVVAHVAAGGSSLVAGAVALGSRKGGRLHRTAGVIFLVSMLIMSVTAAWLSYALPLRGGIIESVLTFYLVVTAWTTVRPRGEAVTAAERAAPLLAVGGAVGGLLMGLRAAANPDRLLDGFPPGVHYLLGAFAGALALADTLVAWRGTLSRRQRIRRHLWRMCVALAIASINFFVGNGAKVLPEALQASSLRLVPVIAPFVLMLYWLIRVGVADRPTAGRRSTP